MIRRRGQHASTRLQWMLQRLTHELWFRASAFSLLAVGTALLGAVVKHYIPDDLPARIGVDAVDNLLGVLAASMLSVAIFSLSTLVSALSAATDNATPRATRLLSQDPTAQNALSTFIGAFLFSLVGIIALQTGIYGNSGRVVLYVVTMLVVIGVVVTLLRWIDHVSNLGRVGQIADRVEAAACRAVVDRARRPYLGGRRFDEGTRVPADARCVYAERIGYVQHVDMVALHDVSAGRDVHIYVDAPPGRYVHGAQALARIAGPVDEAGVDRVRAAFSVADERSFEQDPRFGITVLAEIGSRALSSAVNDPGTAIDVLGRAARVLSNLARADGDEDADTTGADPATPDAIPYGNLHVPGIEPHVLFDDLFTPLARDGAGIVEVAVRLQEVLAVLAAMDGRFVAPAVHTSALALLRANEALTLEDDRRRVREAAGGVLSAANRDPQPGHASAAPESKLDR